MNDATAPTAAPTAVNAVTFSNGEVRDFKQKGQLQREISLTDTGVSLTIYTVTGNTHNVDIAVTGSNFAKTMTARGAMEIITNSCAGTLKESTEEFDLSVEQAVDNIRNERIPAREPGTGGVRGFADLIRAMVELRQAAVAAAEEGKFDAGFADESTVRALILGSSDEENKTRLAKPVVKAKVDGYKAQRAAAKAAKSASTVDVSADDLEAAGLL